MMQNVNAPVPAEEWGAMTDYLIKNFPERSRPPAAIIDGPVKADIRMWDVPTLGSRPHDPLAARDSSIWWTGQLANKLGRLDPKTGAIREYTLKSPLTGPHGLAEDKSGNIWFTGNSAALIGKLDPSTGLVTEYPLPDASAKDPHTLNFDQSGILWFTVQQANMIGRLDPATGSIKLVTSPTPKSPTGCSSGSTTSRRCASWRTSSCKRSCSAPSSWTFVLLNSSSRDASCASLGRPPSCSFYLCSALASW